MTCETLYSAKGEKQKSQLALTNFFRSSTDKCQLPEPDDGSKMIQCEKCQRMVPFEMCEVTVEHGSVGKH